MGGAKGRGGRRLSAPLASGRTGPRIGPESRAGRGAGAPAPLPAPRVSKIGPRWPKRPIVKSIRRVRADRARENRRWRLARSVPRMTRGRRRASFGQVDSDSTRTMVFTIAVFGQAARFSLTHQRPQLQYEQPKKTPPRGGGHDLPTYHDIVIYLFCTDASPCQTFKEGSVPTLARFYGIVIRMYFLGSEHNPPHTNAIYGRSHVS